MLKIETRNGITSLEFNGNVNDAIADVGVIIRSVWQEFDNDDKDAADFFKFSITDMVSDGVPFITEEELLKKASENVDVIARALKDVDKEDRKKIMDGMPDELLAEVISEVMKDAD